MLHRDATTPNSRSTALPIAPQISEDPLFQYALHMLQLCPIRSELDELLLDMERAAEVEQIAIIGPLVGATLEMLVALKSPAARRVLDIGSAIGYSALRMARALPHSEIISIEMDAGRAERAQKFVRRAGYQHRVKVLVGDVFDLLPTLDGQFDVIFQDVMKHAYFATDACLATKLLDLCVSRLASDGLMLTDNAFCMGKVLQLSERLPNQVKGIQAYNRTLAESTELESVIIPLRDGLWVSRRRGV